jgi:hypothetical protein
MDASLPSDKSNKSDDDKRNDVVATTVLEATRPVKFLVTPILVKVVQEVTEIINKDVRMHDIGKEKPILNISFLYRIGIWRQCWIALKLNTLASSPAISPTSISALDLLFGYQVLISTSYKM